MKNKNDLRQFTFLLIFLIIACLMLNGKGWAQSTLATLEGKIADDQGSSLPGATVILRNIETGYVLTATTRADGQYILSGILPGKYECEVSLSGFATQIRKGLTFAIGARLALNFTLSPATVSEEVTVTAEAPMIEVSKSDVSTVVDRKKIDDLPLLDRNYEDLTLLSPGVAKGPEMREGGGGHYEGFRASGMPRGYEEMLLDGVSNETTPYGKSRAFVPADAIQEFRVITHQFAAEYGNASGMIRTAVTRSGTNDLQGRVSFYYRDEGFDDVNYFVNHSEYKGDELPQDQWEKPPYNFYRYGGFLGGPIKKDKAHFFLSYDGVSSTTYSTITSPLVEHQTVDVPRNQNSLLFKLNYQPNEKHALSVRYGLNRNTTKNAGVGGLNTMDWVFDDFDTRHDFQLNWTFFPSEKTMNELRLLYGYTSVHTEVLDKWVTPDGKPRADAYNILRPSGNLGAPIGHPMFEKTGRYELVDNFSAFLGDHSLKFGVDVSRTPWHNAQPSGVPGIYVFDTDEPFDANNPATYPFLFAYMLGDYEMTFNYYSFQAFAQDSWKIHQRLTLNFGVRYSAIESEGIHLTKGNIRNFNPRFGFSWDPSGDGKSVIRGGIGMYTANPTANVAGYTVYVQNMKSGTIYFPGYPDPSQPNPFIPPQPGQEAPTVFDAMEGQVPPYTVQATLGYQREVAANFTLGADLVWAGGYRLMYQHDNNPVIPGTYFVRVDPTTGEHFTVVDWGHSDYKGLFLTLSKRYSHGWGLELSYTLSKAMTDTESEFSRPALPYEDPYKTKMYGPATMDARHRLTAMGIVDLPLGLQLSALFYYVSATPWNALYMADVNMDGLRSDYVDAYQNARRGFPEYYLNSRLSKFFNISSFRIQIFAEGFNITNRANYIAIYNRTPSPLFGQPIQAGSPRQFQFGIRLDW